MLLTVKEYAEASGKTVQSVYKQLKSKSLQEHLEGHLIYQKQNNKQVLCLDDVAVELLNSSANSSRIIVEQAVAREQIEEYQQQIAELTAKVMQLQDALIVSQAKTTSLQDQNILLLEQKQSPEDIRQLSLPRLLSYWRELRKEKRLAPPDQDTQ